MGAQFTKAKWRRYFSQQSYNINVLDETLGVRIIFRPEMDKFSKMMRTKNGPITGEVVKVVHNDGNEQVENQEGTNNKETDEERISHIRSTSFRFSSIIRIGITNSTLTEK